MAVPKYAWKGQCTNTAGLPQNSNSERPSVTACTVVAYVSERATGSSVATGPQQSATLCTPARSLLKLRRRRGALGQCLQYSR
jgi:hypothetical protein